MGGGLIQLVATGAQDVYLTGNPQISYFKKVQRKYTNFSNQMITKRPIIQKPLENNSDVDRIHLVVDTYVNSDILGLLGIATFW